MGRISPEAMDEVKTFPMGNAINLEARLTCIATTWKILRIDEKVPKKSNE